MSRGRRWRRWWLGAGAVATTLVVAACSSESRLAMPDTPLPPADHAAVVEVVPATAGRRSRDRPARAIGQSELPSARRRDDEASRRGRPSPACASGSTVAAGVHLRPWQGTERRVIVRLPGGPPRDRPPPVVFNLHGSAASAATHEAFVGFSGPATDRGYLVVYPEGVPPTAPGELQVWRFLPGEPPDDPGYLASLVDWIGEVACVDLDRVVATGFSNGATMTNVLACHTDGRFRAIAAVGAHRFPLTCPSGPISVLGIHGTEDVIVPYLGGPLLRLPEVWMPPVEETFDAWARTGRCDPVPRHHVESEDLVRHQWGGCAEGVEVVLYRVEGGGHVWPSSSDPLSPSPIDATTAVLDFFDRR